MQTRDSVSPIEPFLDRWKLSDPVLVAETPTSWVFKVARKKGGAAALKLLRPGMGEDERLGGHMLDWYGGQGAARVYALANDALLLEWLDGQPLSELVYQGKDGTATELICQIVAQLHLPRETALPELLPLGLRFDGLFNADKARWPFAARDLFVRAQIVARGLLETATHEVPLHGDLHHGNILFSPRSWVAIDPKGLYGDPAYEVANCFMNPMDATDICADPDRIARLTDNFSQRLGMDRVRVLGFAVVHAALSACWSLEVNQPVKHQLVILPRLIFAHELALEAAR